MGFVSFFIFFFFVFFLFFFFFFEWVSVTFGGQDWEVGEEVDYLLEA